MENEENFSTSGGNPGILRRMNAWSQWLRYPLLGLLFEHPVVADAWVVLRFKEHNFWVELPYGFTRNPDDPPINLKQDRTDPVFPAKAKGLGPNDLMIPWEYVSYQVVAFDKNESVRVNLSNHFDACAELELYGFPGDVREPRASLGFIDGFGRESPGRCISLSLDRDSIRRQMFHYGRSGCDNREWGTVHLSIGEVKRTFTVPSSVFKYVQGHADVPENVPRLKVSEKWWSHL
jgi:hypothetical protein